MTGETAARGVSLPSGQTGSSSFHALLLRASEQFPDVLRGAELPRDPLLFKQRCGQLLPRFEALRASSSARAEIAQWLCLESLRELRFARAGAELGLEELLAEAVEPLPLVSVDLPGKGRLVPSVSFEDHLHMGQDVSTLADELAQRHLLTQPARAALHWVIQHARENDGLSLRGQRFVLLGAAAELAPAELLLLAGADVLWLDVREPSVDLLLDPRLGGSLHYVKGGVSLLEAPHAVAATIRRFAREGAVHLCMYAYAGGEAQEWPLAATMHAITRLLPSELVSSAAMLISPTTVCVASKEDVSTARERLASAPGWKRTLHRTGQLSDGFAVAGDKHVTRAVLSTQGVSYQAAQYLGKLLAAEAYAVYGNRMEDPARPLTVSANVAPITATRSLTQPVFQAAFLGADLFDITIFKPLATRALMGLMLLHDVSNPDAPGGTRSAARVSTQTHAAQVHAQQIHGGVYAQPYALEGCISVAALRGLTQKPGLALRLFG